MFDEFWGEDAEAELEARGQDVDQQAAEGDDPAPTSLRVVVLPEGGGLGVKTFQS